jgi:hypothetical protein
MIIGFLGQKRSGKDTICDYLVNKYKFKKVAFADKIKEVAEILFDLNEEELFGYKKEEILDDYNITPREFYQKFGTEIMQNDIYKYLPKLEKKIPKKLFWTISTFNKINKMKLKGQENFCIADVRFKHEVDYIKKQGGIIIKIIRKEIIKNDKHKSECEIDDINQNDISYVLYNDKNLEFLYEVIDYIMDIIKKK